MCNNTKFIAAAKTQISKGIFVIIVAGEIQLKNWNQICDEIW